MAVDHPSELREALSASLIVSRELVVHSPAAAFRFLAVTLRALRARSLQCPLRSGSTHRRSGGTPGWALWASSGCSCVRNTRACIRLVCHCAGLPFSLSRLPSLAPPRTAACPLNASLALEICVVTRLLSAGEGRHSEPDGLLKATGD